MGLLFSSGFASGVSLAAAYAKAGAWEQKLTGVDSETGSDWDSVPGGNTNSAFIYLVATGDTLTDTIGSSIVTAAGPGGANTTMLRQDVKAYYKDAGLSGYARHEMEFKNNLADALGDTHYSHQWRLLQSDLLDVMPVAAWRQVWEAKEASDAYRIWLQFARQADGTLIWTAAGQFDPFDSAARDWTYQSTVPVPINTWFALEVYCHHHHENGRFTVRIRQDGEATSKLIVDHRGRTASAKNTAWRMISPLKLYAAQAAFEAGVHTQWISSIELHDSAPDTFNLPGTWWWHLQRYARKVGEKREV